MAAHSVLVLVCLIFALVLFVVATWRGPAVERFNLVSAGLVALTLAFILEKF